MGFFSFKLQACIPTFSNIILKNFSNRLNLECCCLLFGNKTKFVRKKVLMPTFGRGIVSKFLFCTSVSELWWRQDQTLFTTSYFVCKTKYWTSLSTVTSTSGISPLEKSLTCSFRFHLWRNIVIRDYFLI